MSGLIKIFTNPSWAYKVLISKFKPHQYVGSPGNRSASDFGPYVASVYEALNNYKSFSQFKQDPRYQLILEHTSMEQGQAYLDTILKNSPEFIERPEEFKINDEVGGSTRYKYPSIGIISPSTLRYMKIASDLKRYFGDEFKGNIAEIGVGYGGQFLVFDRVFKYKKYDLFDLKPVLSLAEKYLESFIINGAYNISALNQHVGDTEYDLVISNYAFSELPSKLQLKYIDKILSKSRRGYLIMNSGRDNCGFLEDKLSIEELEKRLPSFRIVEEIPTTHPGNYTIIWGD
jgi:putative sugar O-methyltransferase